MIDKQPNAVLTDLGDAFRAAFLQIRVQYRFEVGEYAWKLHYDTPDGRKLTCLLRVDIKNRIDVLCTECNGVGQKYVGEPLNDRYEKCEACKGTGKLNQDNPESPVQP